MSDKVTITIDGNDHEVTANQSLSDALNEAGVFTPTFCYHPDLAIAGNCRICLVEMDGPRGPALMISCHQRPRPGMVVRTQESSEKVRNARKGVMELLLVNHPLDCPVCDKAGECTLQEHYMNSGQHESRLRDAVGKVYKGGVDHRFTDTKGQDRGGKKIDLGETVVLDQERCISCSRCVRFMRDVAGDEQLYLAGRGDTAYITTFPGDPLKHEYDLCVTDICPVGALTGKHFRFQQRTWFLKKVNSIAPDDSLGANITLEYNKGKVWRIMPRRNVDVNKSWLSNTTRMLYTKLNENRITEALIDGEQTSLAAGLKAAGQALSEAKNIAIVTSGHSTLEDNQAAVAFAESLGSRAELFGGSWLSVGEADGIARSGDPVANRAGIEALGIPHNLDSLAERADAFDAVVLFNHDVIAAGGDKADAIKAIKTRIVLDSWHNDTTAAASIVIGVRCWAEIRGTMINSDNRIQVLNAVPVCPNQDLEPVWQVLTRLSGLVGTKTLGFVAEYDCFKAVAEVIPVLQGHNYRSIGEFGLSLTEVPAEEVSA